MGRKIKIRLGREAECVTNEKKTDGASEFLDRVDEFLAYPEEDMTEIRQRLIDKGLEPDKAVKRVMALVDLKRKEKRLEWQKPAIEKKEKMNELLIKQMTQNLKGTREDLMRRINELMSRKKALAFARNLNLQEMSQEELVSLLATLEIADKEEKEEPKGGGRESGRME
jgi:hypothetical protein